eukprot:12934156-Prorocentrum_lima.AAC.1
MSSSRGTDQRKWPHDWNVCSGLNSTPKLIQRKCVHYGQQTSVDIISSVVTFDVGINSKKSIKCA